MWGRGSHDMKCVLVQKLVRTVVLQRRLVQHEEKIPYSDKRNAEKKPPLYVAEAILYPCCSITSRNALAVPCDSKDRVEESKDASLQGRRE